MMLQTKSLCRLVDDKTAELIAWCEHTLTATASHEAAAEILAKRLGMHYRDGYAEVGFWAPELAEKKVLAGDVSLEIFTPLDELKLAASQQQVTFRRELLPLAQYEGYLWGVIAGLQPGSREQLGSLYRVKYRDRQQNWHTIADYLAYSVPFGAFAPAECYDVARLDRERTDRDYFTNREGETGADGILQLSPPLNILQIHVPTASAGGTLASLNRRYRRIAAKVQNGHPLTPDEENYVGYDAVQLPPIEPTIEYEAESRFWEELEGSDPLAETVQIKLYRPDMTNWGYDIVISGSAAVNPVLLESDRPDELVDFAATLHTFPGKPIKLIFDVVFGHTDNQAIPLLNRHFFAGSNMYGQNLNYRHPTVRAIMLEMQRRKVNLGGADGVRVDGAQDFKWWDADKQVLHHADDYLQAMSDIVQEVAGNRYRPYWRSWIKLTIIRPPVC